MALSIGDSLPSLEGATEWFNGSPETIRAEATPLLVQFWANSCPACKHAIPRALELVQSYEHLGLRLLAVHMPRGEADLDVTKVREAIEDLTLHCPCAVDNEHTLGKAFQTNRVWPSFFLFDANGKLRSRAAGSLGLKAAENSLRRLLETTHNAGASPD